MKSINQIQSKWLRRTVTSVLAIPVYLAYVFVGVLEAIWNDSRAIIKTIKAGWDGNE